MTEGIGGTGQPLPPGFLDKLRRAQAGDQEARAQLVEENLRLVWSVVARFRSRGDEEDLFQVGSLGLLRAVDRFDPSFGVRFSTYAVPLIIGEIRRDLRSQGAVKVSRSLRELGAKMARVQEEERRRRGREPTLEEVAREVGVGLDEATLALEAQTPLASLDAQGAEEAHRPLSERLPDEKSDEAVWLRRIDVEGGLSTLDPFERTVLTLRFYEDLTQQEIADRLGTNQVRISRTERRALLKVRRYLLRDDPAPDAPAGG